MENIRIDKHCFVFFSLEFCFDFPVLLLFYVFRQYCKIVGFFFICFLLVFAIWTIQKCAKVLITINCNNTYVKFQFVCVWLCGRACVRMRACCNFEYFLCLMRFFKEIQRNFVLVLGQIKRGIQKSEYFQESQNKKQKVNIKLLASSNFKRHLFKNQSKRWRWALVQSK